MSEDTEKETSVREDILSAFESHEVSETEPTPTPPADEPVDHGEEEPVQASDETTKTEAAAKDAPKEEGKSDKVDPPARWTKEEKEEFEALDPEVQRILLNRNKGLEASYTQRMQQIAQERQRYNSLEQAIAPHRQSWAGTGMDDATAINQLMGYYQHAQSDPMGFIQQFAESRGIDLASTFAPSAEEIMQYLQQQGGEDGEGSTAPALHPDVARQMEALKHQQQQLQQMVQQQQGYISQTEQQRVQATRSAASTELERFVNAVDDNGNTKYEFFEDLRGDMSQLMANGMAQTLEEAYDKAMWMRPDVRSKVTENMQLQQRREFERRQREEGAKARRAASSVQGSSAVAPSPVDDDEDGDGSVRAILERQWRQQMQRDSGLI